MNKVVIDVESLGYPFDSFDMAQQDYLIKYADSEDEVEEVKSRLGLSPFTAQLVAIGMLNPDTRRGKILYQSDIKENFISEDSMIEYTALDEKEILSVFWEDIKRYNQFITFNGRGFDAPFLILRSAILGIKPSRNLLPYRYDSKLHCDLLDQLSFYGAFRRYSLDFYCKAFGIKSPKIDGLCGSDIQRLYEEKKFRQIADYCIGDVIATAELFKIWNEYVNI